MAYFMDRETVRSRSRDKKGGAITQAASCDTRDSTVSDPGHQAVSKVKTRFTRSWHEDISSLLNVLPASSRHAWVERQRLRRWRQISTEGQVGASQVSSLSHKQFCSAVRNPGDQTLMRQSRYCGPMAAGSNKACASVWMEAGAGTQGSL